MIFVGIDPGDIETGWALWDGERFLGGGVVENKYLLQELMNQDIPSLGGQHYNVLPDCKVAIECIGTMSQGVGRTIFDTCIWMGMFIRDFQNQGVTPELILRSQIKSVITGKPGAKDGDVNRALREQIGEKGTKKNPGPLYGIRSHAWQALACAVVLQIGKYDPVRIFETDRGEGMF